MVIIFVVSSFLIPFGPDHVSGGVTEGRAQVAQASPPAGSGSRMLPVLCPCGAQNSALQGQHVIRPGTTVREAIDSFGASNSWCGWVPSARPTTSSRETSSQYLHPRPIGWGPGSGQTSYQVARLRPAKVPEIVLSVDEPRSAQRWGYFGAEKPSRPSGTNHTTAAIVFPHCLYLFICGLTESSRLRSSLLQC